MLATRTELTFFDLSEVEAAVGKRSFQRGRAYARGGRVRSVAWDAGDGTLTGSVVGNGGVYETAAFFAAAPDGAPRSRMASARAPSATTASTSRRS